MHKLTVRTISLLFSLFVMMTGFPLAFQGGDDPTPRAELQDSPIIEVCSIERKSSSSSGSSSNDQWGSSVEVAAGAKNSNIHKAKVRIYFYPEPDESQEVEVSVSGSSADGAGSPKKASVLVFVSGTTVTTLSGVDSVTLIVPPEGITGTFTSSDQTGNITVKADNASIAIDQKWDYYGNNGDWKYASIFNYDVPEDVSLTIKLDKNNPIDKHDLVFEVTKVSYLFINDETWEIEDHSDVTENLHEYSIFGPDTGSGKQKVITGTNGKSTAQQTVYGYPYDDWRYLVYEVSFGAYDDSVRKE